MEKEGKERNGRKMGKKEGKEKMKETEKLSIRKCAIRVDVYRTVKEHIFGNLVEARKIIETWSIDYNTQRPHPSLGGLTSAVYANLNRSARPASYLAWRSRPRTLSDDWHRFSRQKSSFAAGIRNLRDAANVSYRKSKYQRSRGPRASGLEVGDPRTRFRNRRRLKFSFSSAYDR